MMVSEPVAFVARDTWTGLADLLRSECAIKMTVPENYSFGTFTTRMNASNGKRMVSIHWHHSEPSLCPVITRLVDGDDRGMPPMPATGANTVLAFAWLLENDNGPRAKPQEDRR